MLITQKGHAALRAVVESKLAGEMITTKIEDNGTDLFGEPLPKMQIANGIAIIPVCGPIVKKASLLEKVCGVCDVESIRADIKTALSTADLQTIVFNIASPGGTVTGIPELANYIVSIGAQVNTVAYIGELGASAAWWIASACKEIYAAESADILSIGVYNYVLDYSEAYKNEGVKVDAFVSGDLKAIGLPGLSMTDAQRKYMQDDVDKIGVMFRSFVKQQRPMIPDDMMRGQCLMGYEVYAVGGIDGTADDISALFAN